MKKNNFLYLLLVLAALWSCGNEKPKSIEEKIETATKKMGNRLEKVAEEIEEKAEELDDRINKSTKKIEQEVEKVSKDIQEKIEK